MARRSVHIDAFLADAFAHRSFYTQTLVHTEPSTHTHRASFTHKTILTQRGLYTQQLDTQKPLHREKPLHFTCGRFYTQKLSDTELCLAGAFAQRRLHSEAFTRGEAFERRSFYTQTPLQREAVTHKALTRRSVHIHVFFRRGFCRQRLLHTEAFTHRILYKHTALLSHTEKPLHREGFYTQKLVHREAFRHRSLYSHRSLHRKAFTHSHAETFTHTCSETSYRITDVECISRAQTTQ